jgi:mannose-6-phosphate isomerase-like protein (cupin superfamily)
MASFTHFHLSDVKNMAPDFGIEGAEARFATGDADAKDTGFSYFRLDPNSKMPFGHKHVKAEEVYVVVSGSGQAKLDEEIVDVKALDAIRVAPEVTRAFGAGDDGLAFIAFGPRHEGDGELVQEFWT